MTIITSLRYRRLRALSGWMLISAQFGLEPEKMGLGCVYLNKKWSRTSVMKDSYCIPNLELLFVLDPIIYPRVW